MRLFKALLLLVVALPVEANLCVGDSVDSYRLSDYIKSNGSGSMDLFDGNDFVVDGAYLENLRAGHGGELVFALDVNENASGSEKAESQGVAYKSATLTLTFIDGNVVVLDQFSALTQAMLLEEGASGRQLFYTAIGDAGANRLNSEGYVGNTAFDATLRFAVPEQVADLGQLSSALLDVELLVTDTRQGDPEAFYDFTNGFESVGVLNCADAAALDDLAPGGPAPGMIDLRPDPATVVSWRYFPAAEAHYLVAYEDLYPNTGDYDFNDMIVSYQVSVGTTEALNVKVIRVEGYMVARGSTFSHDWSLAIDLPAATTGAGTLSLFAPGSAAPMTGYPAQVSLAGDLDIQPFSDSRALLANPLGSAVEQVNTYLNHPPLQQGQRFYVELEIDNNDVDLNTLAAGAPFDPYLFVRDTSQEVHLPNRSIRRWDAINQKETAFVDSNGYPFALLLPSDWAWPIEYVDIGTAYPRLLSFINSSTTQDTDWYLFPVEGLVQPVTTAFWQWAH